MEKAIPEYRKPPVVEVVCGASIRPLSGLLAPHFGVFWDAVRADYPNCKEVAPLSPPGGTPEFYEIPPLPRLWFVSQDETSLIQVQRDRFLYNWRKIRPDNPYPLFSAVVSGFDRYFRAFREFVLTNIGEEVEVEHLEVSYVNHIVQGKGWETLRDVDNVIRIWAGQKFDIPWKDPVPEGVNFRTTYSISELNGRLTISLQSGKRKPEDASVLILEMNMKGTPPNPSPESASEWFKAAEECLVSAFAGVTTPEVQQNEWGLVT